MSLYRNDKVEKIMNNNPFMEHTVDFNNKISPTTHSVLCSGAVSEQTPVALAGGYNSGKIMIKSIGTIIDEYGDHDLPMYGAQILEEPTKIIGATKVTGTIIVGSMMYAVPRKVAMPKIISLAFSNGLILKCSPTTGIMKRGGDYLKAESAKVGDKILGYTYTNGNDHMDMIDYQITRITTELSFTSTGCLFVSMTGNILIPQIDGENYSFIVVQQ